MYLIDANVFLELLYRRQRWAESYRFLEKVKSGEVRGYVLQFAVHGVSAILAKPELVEIFLSEIATWRGLEIVKSDLGDEIEAARAATRVGLDFDDGLHYNYAKKLGVPIVSFDRDFDKTDVKRLEPRDAIGN
ncbi:putative nucleic acid-binding protein, contains PIN domain [Pyrobaculum oguniense TE7]|uniref:Nucleic acid-binding protein, contains PIN domain n=1 Tax=Pyrobaculum oguniense (strain DSM 13380 / JCM 10595 / TE7) TaxID=698757 RepID=H6Q9K1_PYROT|nr:putative nucleic acid-binding protein, contains PIN domain [Pyrobaculum oguniense TE7]